MMALPTDRYQESIVDIDGAREIGIETHGDGDMSIYTPRGNLYLPPEAADALLTALEDIDRD